MNNNHDITKDISIEIILHPGQSLYCVNKETGVLTKVSDDAQWISQGKRYIVPAPEMFYFGALNDINARYKLEAEIQKAANAARIEKEKQN